MKLRPVCASCAISAILAACSSSAATTSPPPPPPPPPAAQHLYIGQDAVPGSILVYDLPLTSSSSPVVTVPYNGNISLSVNTTTLAANRITDFTASLFHLPLTSASVPYATIPVGLLETPLFLPSGTLYLGAPDTINAYAAPFASTSTPSSRVATPNVSNNSLAIDPGGTVYAGNANRIDVISGGAVTTSLVAPAGTAFVALAASATQLIACEGTGSSSQVWFYALPLTVAATPTVTMSSGTVGIHQCALDANGNLYITWGPTIVVFAPPFTSSSRSSLNLSVNGGANGIAIGP